MVINSMASVFFGTYIFNIGVYGNLSNVEVGKGDNCNSLNDLSLFFLASEKDPQEQNLVEDESDEERPSKRCCTRWPFRAVRRVTCGLILGACVAVSWAWGTHSAKETLIKHPTPFFIIWFCSIWNILFFPFYYLCHLLTEKQKQLPITEFRSEENISNELWIVLNDLHDLFMLGCVAVLIY